MRLVYNGEQQVPGGKPVQLWTIDDPGNPLHGSTRTVTGLVEAGVLSLATVENAGLI